jgi:tripartite-type tricarboxylate transporter receptor subunit TctC
MARAMEKPLGQSVVVENKDGANGAVGGKEVLGQKPDGYNLVMLFQSLMAIGPLTIDDPNAIQMDDMDVISGLTTEDYVLVTSADSKYKSLDDLLKSSSTVKFGTTGAGTGSQLAQVLLFADAGVKSSDVPFDGGSGALTAVLGNQVDVAAVQVAEAAPQLDAKKVRALATFSDKRIGFLPDVPTAKESGHDIVVDQRRWLAAPRGLPDKVRSTLADAVATAQKDPEYQKFLKTNYISPWPASPDAVVKQVDDAHQNFKGLLDQFHISLKSS